MGWKLRFWRKKEKEQEGEGEHRLSSASILDEFPRRDAAILYAGGGLEQLRLISEQMGWLQHNVATKDQPVEMMEDIGEKIEELKDLIRALTPPTQPTQSIPVTDSVDCESTTVGKGRCEIHASAKLTGSEEKLIRLLEEEGALTYAQIAERLHIARSTAKNLVNRMMHHPAKALLLTKQKDTSGRTRVCPAPCGEPRSDSSDSVADSVD